MTKLEYELFRAMREYSRRRSEQVSVFERRMDDGYYDRLSEEFGRIYRLGTYLRYAIVDDHTVGSRTPETGGVVRADDRIRLTTAGGSKLCEVIRIAPLNFDNLEKSSNLTRRQKSNILKYSNRFFFGGELLTKERGMSNDFSEADLAFLNAAKSGDAVSMAIALADGANINAIDPKTGQTALHVTASESEMICVQVLLGDADFTSEVIRGVKDDTEHDPVLVDLSVRLAQAQLDPTILDRRNRFALNCAPLPADETALATDPIAQLQMTLADLIYLKTSDALKVMGVSPDVTHDDFTAPDERRAIMSWARHAEGSDAPQAGPSGMD
ncbi:hypothetical protein [uncultured Tateyamaria sp.]|uniref:hypothetical protein n=1 Tax=uncultured Tateyamaria sp. TaxID=455651 RepID=UPI002623920C|nr:hypothetical protein [uncultured Tateyamaria sp.]